DKGATPYNLRNCAYLDEFEKNKIVYPDIGNLNFCFDDKKIYFNNTVYFLNSDSKYILALLNSKIISYYYNFISSTLGTGGNRAFKIFIELLPIPKISKEAQKPFETLVDKIIELKAQNQDTTELENQIDTMVYQLYGLSEEEIAIVEGETQCK
ncbi:MAG: class I SAM-dependent DNA methyltransferase, partial [Campylobacterales bacterium]|nr:class I SAM-dependent DNA methyltransferase [Campylobacterales bacterium]